MTQKWSTSGRVTASRLLDTQPALTSIIAGNDTIALGVMRAARERGLSLPRDLSIIGYDDLPFAAFLEPPLTTIRTRPVEQGERATRMLIGMIRGDGGLEQIAGLRAEFVLRGSCAAPREVPLPLVGRG